MTTLINYQNELKDKLLQKLNTVGKAGLELFTSGGKSFIAMSIIEDFIREDNRNVLWIAPKAAMDNIKTRYLDSTSYSERISYCSIGELSRYHEIFDSKYGYDQIGLIIIDEAHKLMAKQAYDMYSAEISKFTNFKLLAMTASSFRNLDGIKSLERLVGSDNILRYSLGEAIDESIANTVKYHGTSMSYNKSCYMAIENFRNKYGNIPYIKNILDEVMEKLSEVEGSFEDNIVNFMNSRVQFNCSEGDRHIVFFSRVAELKLKANSMKAIMKRLYPAGTVINIIEYHGELSAAEAEHNIKMINKAPVPNQVDVILTVDKGSESIHPENIRSEIIFRGTRSMVKFTQMTGRVVTLTSKYNQSSYIFDFCNSIKFLGAESIMIGHRRLKERVESNLDKGITPEELLEDINKLKSQSNSDRAFEVNLDDSLEDLNTIFNRLASMYDVVNNITKISEIIKDNIKIIDSNYNGNIASYMKTNRSGDEYRSYCILQNALLYGSLTKEDRDNIESLTKQYGYRVYLTDKMSKSDADRIRIVVDILDRKGNKSLNLSMTLEEKLFIANLAVDFLTEQLSTDMEAFIKRNTELKDYLLSRFNNRFFTALGCQDDTKRKVANKLIKSIKSADKSNVTYEQWIQWKGYAAFLKHANFDEYEECDRLFATAVLKYITYTDDGVYTGKYELTIQNKNSGAKAIRVLSHLHNGTELTATDEMFIYNLIDKTYAESGYVRSIFAAAGYSQLPKLRREVKKLTKTHRLIEQFINDSTDENLIELIEYTRSIALPLDMQQRIYSTHKVKQVLYDSCKSGNIKIIKHFINRLSADDNVAVTVLKRAALDGAGYQVIINSAFPKYAMKDVNKAIDLIKDYEYPLELMEQIKSTYCKVPFATQVYLQNIKKFVLPRNGHRAENQFINYMIDA